MHPYLWNLSLHDRTGMDWEQNMSNRSFWQRSPVEHSGVTRHKQLNIDRCIPQDERTAPATIFIFILTPPHAVFGGFIFIFGD